MHRAVRGVSGARDVLQGEPKRMYGERVGPYTILRKLGEGGMGAVYEAEHGLLGRRAAIKVLHPAMSANEEVVARFFNEARATTVIADPGIVQIFDFGYHTDGSAYIVMELLPGESMATRLARVGRMAARDAFRLLRQVATSLEGAHTRGVVHRDLKPDNIFIVGDPAVTGGERTKILDFGIAKLADGDANRMKTRTGSLIGTPLFMSPEQCRGVSTIDHRADIYSFGCMMYLCVTGYVPFDGEGVGDIMFAHMGTVPRAPSTIVAVPPVVDDIILTCMAKQPKDRFSSMTALVSAMTAAEPLLWDLGPDPGPIPATPSAITTFSGASGETSTPSPARHWLLAVGGLILLGGAGLAAGLFVRGGEAMPVAAPPPIAASADAAVDAAIDAPVDAPPDAMIDAAIDARIDAAPVAKQPPKIRHRAPKPPPPKPPPPPSTTIDRGD
jgi:serine/threonine-protein kinase